MALRRGKTLRAALLVGTVAIVAAGLLSWQIARDAGNAADRTLSTLQSTQKLVETQQDRDLVTRGELIAGNQAVIGYVTTALSGALPGQAIDRSSIVDLLEERRSQLGLDTTAVIGSDGTLLATTDRYLATEQFAQNPVFLAAVKAQLPRTGLWMDGDRLLHAALLPLARYGSGDAYLLVGDVVGQDFVQTIAGIGAADVVIITRGASGAPRIPVSTLDPVDTGLVLDALRANRGEAGGRLGLALPGRHAESQSAPLFGNPDVRVIALAQGQPVWAMASSHLPVLLLALVPLLGGLAGVIWYRRRVERPLEDLERLISRAADTGDTRLRMPEQGASGLVRIAAAFNRLMDARNARDH